LITKTTDGGLLDLEQSLRPPLLLPTTSNYRLYHSKSRHLNQITNRYASRSIFAQLKEVKGKEVC
jgi:hypothetical protein